MVVALLGCLERNTRLFKQIALNVASGDLTSRGKLDSDELALEVMYCFVQRHMVICMIMTRSMTRSIQLFFNYKKKDTYKAGRVIIADRLRVTKRFQDRVGLQDLLLELADLVGLVSGSNRGQVLDNLFRVLSLAGTRLSRDQDRLIVAVLEHVMVGGVRYRVDVRGHFVALLVPVGEDDFIGVNGEFAVGIDRDQEEARVGLHLGGGVMDERDFQGEQVNMVLVEVDFVLDSKMGSVQIRNHQGDRDTRKGGGKE